MSTNKIANTWVVITYQVQFPQASLETSIAVQKDSPHRRRKISTLSDPASACRADLHGIQAGNTRGSMESSLVVATCHPNTSGEGLLRLSSPVTAPGGFSL